MKPRFTIDGTEALENRLAQICDEVRDGVRSIVPSRRLEALLLGGGYGRGQGGVLRTKDGDQPYNDLEFYVCLQGSHLLNRRRYHHPLHRLGRQLSDKAGIDVELTLSSTRQFQQSPPSMFYYDLLMGNRPLIGEPSALPRGEHLCNAEKLPPCEATRLLMNRCSGLLFCAEKLHRGNFSDEDADFIGRNHAKAQLAFGDVVLTVAGQYHWDCCERRHRLERLASDAPELPRIKRHHLEGVDFKLHPRRAAGPRQEFAARQKQLSDLGLSLWLWLENRRLNSSFVSVRDYALSPINKFPATNPLRNFALNVATFGLMDPGPGAFRYPRGRVINALVLLLWERDLLFDSPLLTFVQRQLHTEANTFTDLVDAYRIFWQRFS